MVELGSAPEVPLLSLTRDPWTLTAADSLSLFSYGIGGLGFLGVGLTSKDLLGASALVASIFPWVLFFARLTMVRAGCRVSLFEDRLEVLGAGGLKSMPLSQISEAGLDYSSTSPYGYLVLASDKSALRIPFLPGIGEFIQGLLERSGAKPILKENDRFRDQA